MRLLWLHELLTWGKRGDAAAGSGAAALELAQELTEACARAGEMEQRSEPSWSFLYFVGTLTVLGDRAVDKGARRLRWLRLLPVAVLSVAGMTGVGVWSVLWMPHTIAASADQFGVIGIGFALLTWMVAVAGVLVVAATGGALISDRLLNWTGGEPPAPGSPPGDAEPQDARV